MTITDNCDQSNWSSQGKNHSGQTSQQSLLYRGSSSLKPPVLYWRGAIDPMRLTQDKKVRTAVSSLLTNSFTRGLGLEKLHNHDIYSIRTNRKARLVFANERRHGKNCLLALAHLTNHEYQKCKFLKPGVLARFRSKYTDHELIWETVSEERTEGLPHFDKDSEIENPITVDFHNSMFIQFSDDQGAVLQAKLPLVVSGPPGSGKSCIALQLISDYLSHHDNQHNKKILCVCLSSALAERMQNDWEQQPFSEMQGDTTVTFTNYDTLLKEHNPKLQGFEQVTKTETTQWFEQNKVLNPETVLEEFQNLSPYTKQEYFELGAKQCLYHKKEEKEYIWKLYHRYRNWLQYEKKYDLRFTSIGRKRGYDLIITDEAVDLSPLAMIYLYQLAKEGNISYFMDTHQDLEDSLSKRIHLKKLMEQKRVPIEWISLPAVYRCPKSVLELANRWLGIKALITKGKSDKKEYRNIQPAEEVSKEEGEAFWSQEPIRDIYNTLRSRYAGTDIAVITTEDRKDELKDKGINSIMVFTPEEIKGLEFPAIILYRPFDSKVFKKINKELKGVEEEKLEAYQNRRKGDVDLFRHSQLVPELNKVFVSFTRAENTLVICQDITHETENIHSLLIPTREEQPVASSSESSSVTTTEQDWYHLARKLLQSGQNEKFEEVCRDNLHKSPEEVKKIITGKLSEKSKVKSSPQASKAPSQSQNMRKIGNATTKRSKRKRAQVKQATTAQQDPLSYVNRLFNNFTPKNITSVLGCKQAEYYFFDVLDENNKSLILRVLRNPKKRYDFFVHCKNPVILKRAKILDKKIQSIISSTSLMLAVAEYDRENIRLLIKKGADVNHIYDGGMTLLMIAAERGHLDIVEYLVEKGADVSHKNKNGDTAKAVALKNHYPEIARFLSGKEEDTDSPNRIENTVLLSAAKQGHMKSVEFCLDNGADVNHENKDGFTALILATRAGKLDIVKLLINHGADVDKQCLTGMTALMNSALYGHTEIADFLLQNGAEIDRQNNYGVTALAFAAHSGRMETVKLLADKGAKIDLVDNQGDSALMNAASSGHCDVVRYLIDKGLDVNQKNKIRRTPLAAAVMSGHKTTASLLIKKGALVNEEFDFGVTALMIAISNGHKNIAELLIKNGANINYQLIDGMSPLMVAASEGKKDIVHLLLKYGADVNLRNNEDLSARQIAAMYQHWDVEMLILNNKSERWLR